MPHVIGLTPSRGKQPVPHSVHRQFAELQPQLVSFGYGKGHIQCFAVLKSAAASKDEACWPQALHLRTCCRLPIFLHGGRRPLCPAFCNQHKHEPSHEERWHMATKPPRQDLSESSRLGEPSRRCIQFWASDVRTSGEYEMSPVAKCKASNQLHTGLGYIKETKASTSRTFPRQDSNRNKPAADQPQPCLFSLEFTLHSHSIQS